MGPPGPNSDHSQVVTVSIPLNTSVISSLVVRRELRVLSDLSFADFFSCMCVNMDLDLNEASIGYKFHMDRARDPPRELSNELEHLAMMQEMRCKILSARTKNPVLFLHNLVGTHQSSRHNPLFLTAFLQHPATHSPSSKRKRDNDPNEDQGSRPCPSTTLDFTREYRELHSRLRCKLHGGRPCRIDPVTIEHNEVNIYQLTLWARMIVCFTYQICDHNLTSSTLGHWAGDIHSGP